MTWNGEYKLYSPDLKKTIKKGTGSNADLNFIFINMLRDCGIEAWPVVLRMRNTRKTSHSLSIPTKTKHFCSGYTY